MHEDARISAVLGKLNHPALPGIELSLGRMRALLTALGDPQQHLPPVIHVAGTNGKGSTIAFMRAMLEAAGKRVHVYSSPHLVRFNERIVLAGQQISDAQLLPYLERVAAAAVATTFFEATTAAALLAFAAHPADILLLEVGMGGRLDATNVVPQPLASAITPIGLDHQEFLGDTLAAIAAEKAGIIKPGVPVFSAMQQPAAQAVLERTAQAVGSPLQMVEPCSDSSLALGGDHQQQNAALAVAVMRGALALDENAIATGLRTARWPARLQRLRAGPLAQAHGNAWLDGGHNAHAAAVLACWLRTQPAPRVLVVGMLGRKDARAFFAPMAGVVEQVICLPIPNAPDAQPAAQLVQAAQGCALAAVAVESFDAALAALGRYKPATVLVAGSLYLAGELLKTHE